MTDRLRVVCGVLLRRPGMMVIMGVYVLLLIPAIVFLTSDPASGSRFPVVESLPQAYGFADMARPPQYDEDVIRQQDFQLQETIINRHSALAPMMFAGVTITATTVQSIAAIPSATDVRFFSCRFSKESLQELSKLSNVTALGLMNCALEPDELEFIGRMPSLTSLDLRGNKVVGGLKHLANVRSLRTLILGEFPVANRAEADDFATLSQIDTLFADFPNPNGTDPTQTDALRRLASLKVLHINTLFRPGDETDAAIAQWRAALPGVVVRGRSLNVRRVALVMAMMLLSIVVYVALSTQRLTFFSRAESVLLPNSVAPHLIPLFIFGVLMSAIHAGVLVLGRCDPLSAAAVSIGYIGLFQLADPMNYTNGHNWISALFGSLVGIVASSWWFVVMSVTGSNLINDIITGQRPWITITAGVLGVAGVVTWNFCAGSVVRTLGELGFTEAFVNLNEQSKWAASRNKNVGGTPFLKFILKWVSPADALLARQTIDRLPTAAERCRLLRASTPQFEGPVYWTAIGSALATFLATVGLVATGNASLMIQFAGYFQAPALLVVFVPTIVIATVTLTYSPFAMLGKWIDRRRYLAGDYLRPVSREALMGDLRVAVARDLAHFAIVAAIVGGLIVGTMAVRGDLKNFGEWMIVWRAAVVVGYVLLVLWLGHSITLLGMAIRSNWKCLTVVGVLAATVVLVPVTVVGCIERFIEKNVSFEMSFSVLYVLMAATSVLVGWQSARVWKTAEFVD